MPGYLRTGGYLRHVQPMALRDGITEWARTFFQEEDRVIKYPFLKRRTKSTASLRLSLRDTPAYTLGSKRRAPFLSYAVLGYLHLVHSIGLLSTLSRTPQSLQSPPVRGNTLVLVYLKFAFWLFLVFSNAPGRRAAEGRWQWSSLDCHSFYSTACAFGLTWRPLTGSLFLSSFLCCLKPGPSGERGRKSSLLQDMLDSGRPTRTTGGRSSRGLTGNDPRTVGCRLSPGEPSVL